MDFQVLQTHLHGMFVHFPIALLMTSVLLQFLALRRDWRQSLEPAAIITLVLGTLGAGLAALTGPEETAKAFRLGTIHETVAEATLILFGLLTAWRLAMLWLHRPFEQKRVAVFMALAVVGVVMLGVTGYLGGTMVYEQGVGVRVEGQLVAPPATVR